MSLRKMLSRLKLGAFFAALLSLTSVGLAGDSIYGTVTAVRQADLVVTFDYGTGTYEIRIAGIDNPPDSNIADAAASFVSQRLLRKNCRLRFEGRTPEGEMIGRLFTDDPDYGIKDVGVELVRNGLAIPQSSYTGYKYGEMKAAEDAAKEARLGLWKTAPK
jgi:endonuclease YncB( thermonuclease family)